MIKPRTVPCPHCKGTGKVVSLLWEWKEEIRLRCKEYLKAKAPVILYHNNELGIWLWSICAADDQEFWVTSFRRRETAVKFCRKVGLRIMGIF